MIEAVSLTDSFMLGLIKFHREKQFFIHLLNYPLVEFIDKCILCSQQV